MQSSRTWFTLGLAVTIIGGATLLIACGLIYFFMLGPGAPQRIDDEVVSLATDTVTAEVTEEATQPLIRTRAPTQASQIINTPTPLPSGTGGSVGSSGGSISRPFIESPEQSVVNYYRDITAGNYDSTWAQLTDEFKQEFNCCAPNYDYSGYTDWWDSVQRVDFGEVDLVEQNGNEAVVYAELIYTMEEGGSFEDEDPYFELVYSQEQGRWLFEDKRDTP